MVMRLGGLVAVTTQLPIAGELLGRQDIARLEMRRAAKRPNRERECLVGERTRIVNRIKSTLARLGIRNFKPTLRKAAERLATVHTPEGMPLPPNTLAELQRDLARLGFVASQIRQIEDARQKRLDQQPETGPHAMVRQLARIVGVGVETADMLVHEVLSRPMRDRRAVARRSRN
jgi:transposase